MKVKIPYRPHRLLTAPRLGRRQHDPNPLPGACQVNHNHILGAVPTQSDNEIVSVPTSISLVQKHTKLWVIVLVVSVLCEGYY
jgi:hypothetical protein